MNPTPTTGRTTTGPVRLAAHAAALTLLALSAASPALADVDVGNGVGSQYYIQTTGATALSAFTTAVGNSGPFLLGQPSLRIGDTTYTLSGGVAQAIGAKNATSSQSFEPGQNADRIIYGFHSTGSINGIRDLAIRNGLLGGAVPGVNASNQLYVMGEVTSSFPAGLANGYGNFVDAAVRTAPVPGVSGAFYDASVGQKPIPQIAFSDVRFEQGFALPGASNAFARPTQAGYGQARNPAAQGFNASSPNFQQLTPVGDLAGGVAAGTTRLRNTGLAVNVFTVSANPGTGLNSLSEGDVRFLQTTGRLANGANFNSVTRDVGSGTRNQGNNNVGIDPSFGAGERDRVSTGTYTAEGVAVTPGDEAAPGFDFATGAAQVNLNENRPGLNARYADKVSGGSGLRPTVVSQRMALGILGAGDVGDRGTSATTTEPLRVLALDFDGTDFAGPDAGAVQPTADNVTSGRYQLWTTEQAVTVRGTLATGADANGNLTGGVSSNGATTILNDVNDDGSGVGIAGKFLNNITGDAQLSNFASGNVTVQNALTPLDALIAGGFIPTPFMQVTKEFDGDTQQVVGRDANAESVYAGPAGDALRARLTYARAGDQNGNVNNQSYRIYDANTGATSSNPAPDLAVGFKARLFLAGDLNGDGVRDLGDTESWADALANPEAFLAAHPDITPGPNGVNRSGVLDADGVSDNGLALLALSDLNGDGNVVAVGAVGTAGGRDRVAAVSRDDVRYFLYGASVDTTAANAATGYAGASDAQTRRELGVRLGQLKKNAAIDRFNARVIQLGRADLAFDKFDTDLNGTRTLNDARVVDRNVGRNYTNLVDVLSTGDDLIAAELTDNNVITHVSTPGNRSDFQMLAETFIAAGLLRVGDTNFDGSVTGQDLSRVASRINQSAGRWSDGDVVGYNGVVTGQDLAATAANFGGGSSPRGTGSSNRPGPAPQFTPNGDGIAELLYDPSTGEIIIVPDGNDIAGFVLVNDETPFGWDEENFVAPLDSDFVTRLNNEISWIAQDFNNGFTGAFDIGAVLPTGLALDFFTDGGFLTQANYFTGLGSGEIDFQFAVVPEPTTAGLLGVAGLGLLARRRRVA